ncbi:putative protein, contains DTW domain [Handroanthus impetiginosus]|uniref:tRNA-uridine aminocarboxypropyltransferase n=1 Tax=Handroanthus impetiginosus TaxID=429701 RepID=A0A2G9I478_9LAMI|nr:putative protein, contains DTW domain [Handroanthus impetiginosus]
MEFPEESTAGAGGDQARRRICTTGCGRPINVCLCHTLPSTPFPTATKIVILHHPHESRHKLATVPLLSKCLQNCEIIVGRKLKYGQSKLLDSLHDEASENPNSSLGRALYLFPGPNALPFVEFNRVNSSLDDVGRKELVLIVFDGTWKHAKEMVLASLSFLSKFAIQVCLDFDAGVDGGTIFDSELILRKEPFAGCMSTMEAVARCLRVLEPNGIDIESRIIEVLRAMVSFQACFLKPMKPRPKLTKNDRGKNEKDENTDSLC